MSCGVVGGRASTVEAVSGSLRSGGAGGPQLRKSLCGGAVADYRGLCAGGTDVVADSGDTGTDLSGDKHECETGGADGRRLGGAGRDEHYCKQAEHCGVDAGAVECRATTGDSGGDCQC